MNRLNVLIIVLVITTGFTNHNIAKENIINDFDIEDTILIKYNGNEKNVTIPDNITKIGSHAFSSCHIIENIIMTDNVTEIMSGAFANCIALENVVISDNVSYIYSDAFYNCKSLKQINLPSKLEYIGPGAFQSCEMLDNIIIPNNVSYIGYWAFKDVINMKNIVLSQKLWIIGDGAFSGCMQLQNISIPSKVIYIVKDAFKDCINLNTVVFEGNAPPIVKSKNIFGNNYINLFSETTKIFIHKNAIGFNTGEWLKYDIKIIHDDINISTKINDPYDILGRYFILGKYNEAPLIWKAIKYDDKGILLFCDNPILEMPFTQEISSNIWKISSIRQWLNSDNEGFLSNTNFTKNELAYINSIIIDNYVSEYDMDLATKGDKIAFPISYKRYLGNGNVYTQDINKIYDINNVVKPLRDCALFNRIIEDGSNYLFNLPEVNIAKYETTDRIFLPDELLINYIYQVFGNIANLDTNYDNEYQNPYWLRSPYAKSKSDARFVDPITDDYLYISANEPLWVRPACYIDVESAIIASGYGTKDEPFILGDKNDNNIRVFCNGIELFFDVSPIIENNRTLVPFRTIFEELGASVEWNNEKQKVRAQLGNVVIELTINNTTAYINGQIIELDVPAKIVNGRTLVPLRFIAENFGFEVNWNDELQIINIKGKMVEITDTRA